MVERSRPLSVLLDYLSTFSTHLSQFSTRFGGPHMGFIKQRRYVRVKHEKHLLGSSPFFWPWICNVATRLVCCCLARGTHLQCGGFRSFPVFRRFLGSPVQFEVAEFNGGSLRPIRNIPIADCSLATCATSCNFGENRKFD